MQAAPGIILLAGIFGFLAVIVWQIAAQNTAHKQEHDTIKTTLQTKLTEVRDGVKEIQTHRDFQAERYAENIQRQDKAIETISANTTILTQLLQRFLVDHEKSTKDHEKAHDELLDKVDELKGGLPVMPVQTPTPQYQNFQGHAQVSNPPQPVQPHYTQGYVQTPYRRV